LLLARPEIGCLEIACDGCFDYRGRAVTVSGDTRRSQTLVNTARGSDLLVHEVLADQLVTMLARAAAQNGNATTAELLTDTLDYHTFPADVFAVAAAAEVGTVALTHLVPPVPPEQAETVFRRGAGAFGGGVFVGVDGLLFTLPADGGSLRSTRLETR
jgi:ribonuclease Z